VRSHGNERFAGDHSSLQSCTRIVTGRVCVALALLALGLNIHRFDSISLWESEGRAPPRKRIL